MPRPTDTACDLIVRLINAAEYTTLVPLRARGLDVETVQSLKTSDAAMALPEAEELMDGVIRDIYEALTGYKIPTDTDPVAFINDEEVRR